ncbi:putative maltokinase [Geminicoccus flavidas]|uniref:putative maltokinase n=1 Tax=Geminicoccus flavidas TaxID=2506407 RepID=UPI00135C16C2|nr:putative maltokinase [Geminicoccus flavidas]
MSHLFRSIMNNDGSIWPSGVEAAAEAALPDFLLQRRWYPAKDAGRPEVTLSALVPFPVPDLPSVVAIWQVTPPGQVPMKLFVPLALVTEGLSETAQVIATSRTNSGEIIRLVEAFSVDTFVHAWMEALLRNDDKASGELELHARRTEQLAETGLASGGAYSIRRGSAEQSNTSIRIGDSTILKVIRKLEEGIHPELEVSQFLTGEAGFMATPALLGWVELGSRTGREPVALSILQAFVANHGDGWSWMLERLSRLSAQDGDGTKATEEAVSWLRRLGQRTAEMHAAFGITTDDPAFCPEPVQPQDMKDWIGAAQEMAHHALDGLAAAEERLELETLDPVRALLAQREVLMKRLQAGLPNVSTFARTRHHGDYHLGQVLVTDEDAVIVDFEGEPLRPLAVRRAKHAALRDVAGMLRSIAYAVAAAERSLPQALPAADREAALQRLREWEPIASRTYLDAYLDAAHDAAGCPSERADAEQVVDFFMLEKALYEVAYELANRPDWLAIPVRGVLALLDAEGRQ